MAFPRILLVVPLLVAGMYLPNALATPAKPAAGVLGMTHEGFSSKEVSVGCGNTLTMVNDSHGCTSSARVGRRSSSAQTSVPVDDAATDGDQLTSTRPAQWTCRAPIT